MDLITVFIAVVLYTSAALFLLSAEPIKQLQFGSSVTAVVL